MSSKQRVTRESLFKPREKQKKEEERRRRDKEATSNNHMTHCHVTTGSVTRILKASEPDPTKTVYYYCL